VRRLLSFGILCCTLGAVIGLVAVVDHRDKTARMNRAERSEWYCTHTATRCGGPSSAGIERRWNRREVGYMILFGALVGSGAICLALDRAQTSRRGGS
jgi:hypothetical protein